MKSKDRIIIQKIIGYISDVEKYIEGLQAKDFLDDNKRILNITAYGKRFQNILEELVNNI